MVERSESPSPEKESASDFWTPLYIYKLSPIKLRKKNTPMNNKLAPGIKPASSVSVFEAFEIRVRWFPSYTSTFPLNPSLHCKLLTALPAALSSFDIEKTTVMMVNSCIPVPAVDTQCLRNVLALQVEARPWIHCRLRGGGISPPHPLNLSHR